MALKNSLYPLGNTKSNYFACIVVVLALVVIVVVIVVIVNKMLQVCQRYVCMFSKDEVQLTNKLCIRSLFHKFCLYRATKIYYC